MLTGALILGVLAVPWPPASPAAEDSLGVPGPACALFAQYRLVFAEVLARRCVYSPSCSHYAQRAMDRVGLLLGVPMALERWTRCHPDAAVGGFYSRGPDGLLLDPPFRGERSGGDPAWSSLALPF